MKPTLWLKKATRRLIHDRLLRNVILFFVILIATTLLAFVIMTRRETPESGASPTNPLGITALEQGSPEYPTLLPAGRTIESLGGWTRVSPRDRNPVFAYSDTIDGNTVNVSQQPVPEEIRGDIDVQIENIALDFRATEKFSAGGTTAYIGISSSGPQFIIMAKNDILILMRSSVPIAIGSWAQYINTLQ